MTLDRHVSIFWLTVPLFMTQWGARFTWRLPRLPRPPFCKRACQMNWTVINWTVVLRFSTENVRCIAFLNWKCTLFAQELNIWPNQLGVTLGRGTARLHDIMNSFRTWKMVWSNEETPPGLEREHGLSSLQGTITKWVVLPGSKSNNLFLFFKYYPRGQPMYYNVCYFLSNWSIPF